MEQRRINKFKLIEVIINCLIFVISVVIAAIGVTHGAGDGQVGTHVIGWGYFKAFTMDSNVIAGISSAIVAVYGIISLKKGEDITPKWAVIFQLITTTALGLTFIIASLFLAPMQVMEGNNYFKMFKDDMFFFHFFDPLLAHISFIVLLKKYPMKNAEFLWGVLPAFVYSIVYLIMVVILHKWSDFYGFTFGGKMFMVPVVMITIYLLSAGISLGITSAYKKCVGKYAE